MMSTFMPFLMSFSTKAFKTVDLPANIEVSHDSMGLDFVDPLTCACRSCVEDDLSLIGGTNDPVLLGGQLWFCLEKAL